MPYKHTYTRKKKHALFALLLLGHTFFCSGQPETLLKLQKSLPTIHDSLLYVNALNKIGILLYEQNIDSTFYYAKRAREIADRLPYTQGQADALNNLGIVYSIKGNVQLGLRYFNEAYNHYLAIHDSSNIVQALINIANVYDATGKVNKALANYTMALRVGKKLNNDSIMAIVIYNYYTTYPNLISKDSLNYYLNCGRNIALKHNDSRMLLAYDQLTANNYIKNNQHQKGVALLKQIAATALNNNLYSMYMLMLIDLGNQYKETDKATAAAYYKQAFNIAVKKGFLVNSGAFAKELAALYAAQKDYQNAFYYSNQLQKINDEATMQENLSGIDYIDYAIKEQQLALAHTRAKYQTGLLILVTIICIMAIVMAIVLWRNWKHTQKTGKALQLQFEQTEAAMHDLDVANKNYARLIKIVAHDLRNPIGAIGAMIPMLLDKELTDSDGEIMQLMQVSVANSLDLINGLLKTDFEQQQNLNKKEIYLSTLLNECVQLLRFKAKDKNQQLIFTANNTHVKVYADREKLWRVMNNLIVNAIKFSANDSTIYINTLLTENGIITVVKDAGIGIPLIMQGKIFDPFTSAKRTGTGGEQPFGLGLYISKQIVEAHQGKIWVKSEPNKGTEFFVELPFQN